MAFDASAYGDRLVLGGGDMHAMLGRLLGTRSRDWLTHLIRRPAGWLAEQAPGLLPDIAAYVDSGAELLIAPSDRLNAIELESLGVEQNDCRTRACELVGQLVSAFRSAISQAASEKDARLIAAIGPTDRILALREIDAADLAAAYREQAGAAEAAGADAILCRSFVELDALVVAVHACVDSTRLPVIASMTFDAGPDFTHTRMGTTIPQACGALTDAGAAAIGCDNSEFPDGAPAIATLLRESTTLPTWLEINAGRAELRDGAMLFPDSPKQFGERLRPLAATGVTFICGGAGVTPPHLSELANVCRQLQRRRRSDSSPP